MHPACLTNTTPLDPPPVIAILIKEKIRKLKLERFFESPLFKFIEIELILVDLESSRKEWKKETNV